MEVGELRRLIVAIGIIAILALCAPAFAVVYVKTDGDDSQAGDSWDTAKATIQAGINAAAANGGDDVWIATGTYGGGFTLKNYVNLYGGFSGVDDEWDLGLYPTVVEANGSGSAIKVGSGANVIIDGLEIYDGYAAFGGGIYAKSAYVDVEECYFNGNHATKNGGAIYALGGALTVGNSTLESNGAGQYGGGIYASSADVTMSFTDLYANYAANNGGGVYVVTSYLEVWNSTFGGNESNAYGGAVCFSRSQAFITGSVFDENMAYCGAAFDCDYAIESLVEDNDFLYNSATYGGAASVRWKSNVWLLRGWFIANYAKYGGAMYIYYSPVLVANALFDSNTATSRGGGVYVSSYSTLDVINDTMVDNSAYQGGAICALYKTNATVANTILDSNAASEGGAAYKDSWTAVGIYSTLYHANGASQFAGGITPLSADGNIHVNPLFVDPSTGDYHLQPGSPAVNAGDDSFVDPSWTDLDGNARQVGPVDMGAYELQ